MAKTPKPKKSTEAHVSVVPGYRSTKETMTLFGYSDSTSFWQSVRRAGIPFVRVSARRALFRERDLEAWMDAKTVGAPVRRAYSD